MKIRVLGAAGALSLSMLTGCGGGSVEDFCDQLEESKAYFDQLDSLDTDDLSDDEAVKMFDEMVDEFKKLKKAAPSEISDDVDLMVDFVTKFADAMKDLAKQDFDDDDPQAFMAFMEALEEAMEGIEEDELEAAGDRLADYADEECDVDLDLN